MLTGSQYARAGNASHKDPAGLRPRHGNPLELFFDLVFVFALTQVTAFMADNLSWQGLLRGVLIIGLLWWSWTGYAWLANVVQRGRGPRSSWRMLVAMAAMFVLALTIPEAFDDAPAG